MRRVDHFDEYTIAMNNSSYAIDLVKSQPITPPNPLYTRCLIAPESDYQCAEAE